MPFLFTGGPEEASAQLIAHLEKLGVLPIEPTTSDQASAVSPLSILTPGDSKTRGAQPPCPPPPESRSNKTVKRTPLNNHNK